MKLINKNLFKVVLISFLVLLPLISFAQQGQNPAVGNGRIANPINVNSIPDFVQKMLEGVVKIGIPIIALAIIYCGFLFVSARGNSEKVTEAKSALLWTIVGSGVLLGAWSIAKLITATVQAL